MRTPIVDGQNIEQFIPAHLRNMFYRHPMPQYKYAIHDGYDPYGFSNDGLVLYLPLWALKGSSFKSVDAYKHLATVTGALWQPDGRTFDGDDLITLADPAVLQLTGDFTVEAWVRREAVGAFHTIASKYETGGNERGWLLFFVDDNTLAFTVSKDGTNFTEVTTVATYTDTSTFLHIVGAYDSIADGSSVMQLDVDNVERAASAAAVSPLNNSTDPVKLGVMQINNVNSRFLVGTLGEFRLYNRFLSAEVRAANRRGTQWRYQ